MNCEILTLEFAGKIKLITLSCLTYPFGHKQLIFSLMQKPLILLNLATATKFSRQWFTAKSSTNGL